MPMTFRIMIPDLLRRGLLAGGALLACCAAAGAADLKFDFSPGEAPPGYTHVTPQTAYDAKRGFGFLEGAAGRRASRRCSRWTSRKATTT